MSEELKELLSEGFAALELAKKLLGQAHEALEAEGWQARHCAGEEAHGPKWSFSKEGEESLFLPTLEE